MKGIVFCALFTERSFSVESFYVVMLVFLALLAAFDLFVGVSNDAVNFLSPAIGSRVAPFKIIMLVASVGVLAGATSAPRSTASTAMARRWRTSAGTSTAARP